MLKKPKAPQRAISLTPQAAKKKKFKRVMPDRKKAREQVGAKVSNNGRFSNANDEVF
jgi:hypothetical protein